MWYNSTITALLTALLVLFGIQVASATEAYESSREVRGAFHCNANSSVEITNSHGDVYINTWEKDSVVFLIKIEAYSEKDIDLDELLDMIEIDFKSYSSFIIAETERAKNSSIVDRAAFGLSKLSGNKEVRVNYEVYMPEHLELSIDNEFGDVFVNSHSGDFSIELAHGDFRAKELAQVKVVKVKYGDVNIDKATGGRYDLSYVKGAKLGEITDAFIKSTYSEIDIEQMDVLRLESRLDELYISDLGAISGKTNLSKVHIRNLRESADLESKYGNLRVDDIAGTAGELKFTGSNTDYTLGLAADATGSFEVQMTGNKVFTSDANFLKVQETNTLDDKTTFYKGKINNSSSGIKLQLFTKNGDVSIGG